MHVACAEREPLMTLALDSSDEALRVTVPLPVTMVVSAFCGL